MQEKKGLAEDGMIVLRQHRQLPPSPPPSFPNTYAAQTSHFLSGQRHAVRSCGLEPKSGYIVYFIVDNVKLPVCHYHLGLTRSEGGSSPPPSFHAA
ncbi:Hypothetical protein NocV09_02300870 [Nannochloropsis oceanica]